MTKNTDQNSCCGPSVMNSTCCKVESVVTIDSKGQLLLPKEVREGANLQAGDKLVVVSMAGKEESCCIVLIKVDYFGDMVKDFLGPMMDTTIKK